MVATLELFETITHKISGATYPTLSLVIPYMYSLKKNFAPRERQNESFETYLNLVYSNQDDDKEEISDDEYLPSGGSRQHWQYSHCQFQRHGNTQSQSQSQDHRRGKLSKSHPIR